MNSSSTTARYSITDSPWYWVYLFCTAGAVALLLAGPKFAARQSQIERKYEDRLHVAKHVAQPQLPVTEREAVQRTTTRVMLWPLYAVLGCVLSVAWYKLWRHHKRRDDTLESQPSNGEVTA
ncbi:MAG: hypothetical protein H8E66_03295 [Planctomycetes bacterium]|nr:hypothetical protein [Planctomycetota bacterium]